MLNGIGTAIKAGWRAARQTYKSVSISEGSPRLLDLYSANLRAETYSQMARAALRNAMARRAIEYIASNMASIASELKVGIDEDGERVDITTGHPFVELRRQPHPEHTWTWMVEGMVWQWMLAGEWWLWPYERQSGRGPGIPQRLHLFRETDFQGFAFDSKTGMPSGYHLQRPDGTADEFSVDSVIHAYNYNPLESHSRHSGQRGTPALLSVIREIQTQQASNEWNYSIAESGGRPPLYLMPEGLGDGEQLSPENQARAQESIDEQWAGASADSKPWVLSGMFDVIEASFSPADAGIEAIEQNAGERIAVGLGIPPILLGTLEGASYANLEWAEYIAHARRILPMLDRFLSELNQDLMPRFAAAEGVPENAYLYYDPRSIDALDVQTKDKAERDKVLVESGIASRDEVRSEHGLEARGGASDLQTIGGRTVPLDRLSAPGLTDGAQKGMDVFADLSEEEFEKRVTEVLTGSEVGGDGEPDPDGSGTPTEKLLDLDVH